MIITTKFGRTVLVTEEDFKTAKECRIPSSVLISRVKNGMPLDRATTWIGRLKPKLTKEELAQAEHNGIPKEIAGLRFSKHGWSAGAAINTPYVNPKQKVGV